jgi:hypothetical protein
MEENFKRRRAFRSSESLPHHIMLVLTQMLTPVHELEMILNILSLQTQDSGPDTGCLGGKQGLQG